MGTMKARVEVRIDIVITAALHAMYDTVHRALFNRYTHFHAGMYVRIVLQFQPATGNVSIIRRMARKIRSRLEIHTYC